MMAPARSVERRSAIIAGKMEMGHSVSLTYQMSIHRSPRELTGFGLWSGFMF